MLNQKLVRDYVIQYGAKAFDLKSSEQSLLIALLHYRSMGKNNVCNPTRERLQMATGTKKLDDITKHSKQLEQKGILERKGYTEDSKKHRRTQYNLNDEFILEHCKEVESKWYEQYKDDESISQAEVLANPEQHTEEEIEEAILPDLKPVPENKQRNPLSGRIEKKYIPPVLLSSYQANDFKSMLSDDRSLEQIKIDSENEKWRKQRASTLRYQQQNRPDEDDNSPF